jgi:arylsulfatase A-like enzyme
VSRSAGVLEILDALYSLGRAVELREEFVQCRSRLPTVLGRPLKEVLGLPALGAEESHWSFQNQRPVPRVKYYMFLRTFGLILCLLVPAGAATQVASPPHVLFLFSDDQRADTIRAFGNAGIDTPNLDRLIARGAAFTRAYCMGAQQGAVCVPSRAMLMTGRTLFRIKANLDGQATWPEAFAKAGYETFITGKWHNEAPSLLRIFQGGRNVFLGGMGADPYALPVQDFGPDRTLSEKKPSGKHCVELFSDTVIDFLKQRKEGKPFLAYVAFNAPHDPRIAPKEYHDKYNAAKPPLPENFLAQHPFNNGNMAGRDEELAPWPRTPEIVRQHLADYYAAISFMDTQVGRILDALKERGLEEKTIVVFASDHGLAIGSHGLFGKQNIYDHSMHAPLVLAGPGVPRGKRSDALCYLLDIFPTLGDLAGVAPPDGSEGKSLAPVLRGSATKIRDSIFTAYTKVQRAVRDERWKLLVYPRINKTQLFDLENDPSETKDLSGDSTGEAEVRRMTSLLDAAQREYGDALPLRAEKPDPLEFDFSKVKPPKKQP